MDAYKKIIVIEASTICNLACPFCAHDNRRKIARHTVAHESLQTFTEVVGKYSIEKREAVLISWLGGEPFLNKNITPITEELRRKYSLHFSATTNGTKLSDAGFRDHIKQHYSELTISVDGFSPVHDRLRGKVGLFDEVKQSAGLLIKEAPDLKVRINIVLMKENFDLFSDLCIELAHWGIWEITFNQLGGRDRPEFYPENRLSIEQVMRLPEIVSHIQHVINNPGMKLVFSDNYYRRILASAQGEKLPILDCAPGSYYMFVNALGQLAPCSFTTDEYGVDISTIQTVADFEQLPSIFHRKKASQQAYYCHDCPCTNVHGKFS